MISVMLALKAAYCPPPGDKHSRSYQVYCVGAEYGNTAALDGSRVARW